MMMNEVPSATTLTTRQLEVLKMISDGESVKDIATRLSISAKTVESHRSLIKQKLGIHTIPGLTKYAIREGLTSL